jgi:hypothetical protein
LWDNRVTIMVSERNGRASLILRPPLFAIRESRSVRLTKGDHASGDSRLDWTGIDVLTK